MIEPTLLLLLLGFAIPMIISPGPGNTLLAAAGGKFGVRGTLPFWLGFEAGNFVWCLVYGFGLSELVRHEPLVYAALKWAGTLYLVYLAWGFFRAAAGADAAELKPLSFLDGFTALSLNPKVHSMILVMYSQFLDPAASLAPQVLGIALVFVVLGFACHFVWIYAGRVLFSRIRSAAAQRAQGIAFGLCMLVVAAFVAFS